MDEYNEANFTHTITIYCLTFSVITDIIRLQSSSTLCCVIEIHIQTKVIQKVLVGKIRDTWI